MASKSCPQVSCPFFSPLPCDKPLLFYYGLWYVWIVIIQEMTAATTSFTPLAANICQVHGSKEHSDEQRRCYLFLLIILPE